MAWLQLCFVCAKEQVARLSELLSAAGAAAVTLCDGGNETLCETTVEGFPLWKVTRISGLFEASTDMVRVIETLQDALAPEPLALDAIETLEERDWAYNWQAHFQPLHFGSRLWVGPSWCSPPRLGTTSVVIDPGLAFGTGSHASTALCLEWLAAAELDNRQVIDFGCGSGILAIAAVKLGAQHAFAVDTDWRALTVTVENAQRNGVRRAITALFPEALPAVKVDYLVANILAEPLIGLAGRFAELVARRGWVVLSGILATEAAAVVAAYRQWFRLQEVVARGEWVRIVGERVEQGG